MPQNQTSLKSAIQRYRKQPGAPINGYEWYRRAAHREGAVNIGEVTVPVRKVAGVWHVNTKDFKKALRAHEAHGAATAQAARDLRRGVTHGQDGDTIEIEGGHYHVRGRFRLEVSEYELRRHRSHGTWYCNGCNQPAVEEREIEECHLCADWGGCGRDCTLSAVRCVACGHFLCV